MATSNVLSHSSFAKNLDWLYAHPPANWSAENVGTGPGVASLNAAFDASPPHFANLTSSMATEVGIGVVWRGPELWVTFDFAGVPPVP